MLVQMGQFEAGIGALRRAVELDLGDVEAHHLLGEALGVHGRWSDAAQEFRHAAGLVPEAARHQRQLGIALTRLDRHDEAAAALEKATSLDLGDVAAHEALAQIYEIQGRMEDALVEYRQASQLAPQEGECHRTVGEAFLRLGLVDEAVEELTGRLLKQSPAALGMIKAQVNRGMKLDWPDALKVDEWTRKGLFAGFITEDARERLRAFREKREP